MKERVKLEFDVEFSSQEPEEMLKQVINKADEASRLWLAKNKGFYLPKPKEPRDLVEDIDKILHAIPKVSWNLVKFLYYPTDTNRPKEVARNLNYFLS